MKKFVALVVGVGVGIEGLVRRGIVFALCLRAFVCLFALGIVLVGLMMALTVRLSAL